MNPDTSSSLILKYFPSLTEKQKEQIHMLYDLYSDWNTKINVISRKDIDQLYLHHVLHSLSIAKYIRFKDHTQIIDIGTGGGFPGIPLAILFPQCHFTLIDSIGKKIKVAQDVASQIGLSNVELLHENIKEEKRKFHFIVSRAVMNTQELIKLSRKNISREQINALPNGMILLKGGDLKEEHLTQYHSCEEIDITTYFQEEYFQTKKIVYVPIKG